MQGTQNFVKNPKNQFFDLSRDYYTGRYKGGNKNVITVKSYLITEDYQNYVKDLSMEIIQTNQGCMPIIKTFEWNAYNKHKFVKAIKFYNYRTDCKLRKQIIVDEGVMNDKFRTYDSSILHFGNCILFYKREENWHKLQQYNVVTNTLEEIEGYNIEEPIGQEIRYHIMFSFQFGEQKRQADLKKKSMTVHEFIRQHYVFCQSYRITEQLDYINMPLVVFSMYDMSKQLQPESGRRATLDHPVQYVCHTTNPNNRKITFIAFDSFNSHHFVLDAQLETYTEYTTFCGNNEL